MQKLVNYHGLGIFTCREDDDTEREDDGRTTEREKTYKNEEEMK